MKRSILGIVVLLVLTAGVAQAAIVGTGDVTPADPATWTSSTTGYIGQNSTGTVTVDGGSRLLSYEGYLGYNSGSAGTATVTGTGSLWSINANLKICLATPAAAR